MVVFLENERSNGMGYSRRSRTASHAIVKRSAPLALRRMTLVLFARATAIVARIGNRCKPKNPVHPPAAGRSEDCDSRLRKLKRTVGYRRAAPRRALPRREARAPG